MSSRSPSQQPEALVPLTPEEELARMMRQVTPSLDDDFEDEHTGGGGQQRLSSPSGATSGVSEADGISPSSGLFRSNELRAARRLAERLNLFPYQRDALNELVKSNSVGQNAIVFAQQCVVENKLNNIIAAAPLYKVTAALKANIESVVMAVLLSSKLSAYKGSIPKDCVLSFLLRDRLHFPSTFDSDTYVATVIETSIGESLTQARSRIKKTIKLAIKMKTKIFDLATRLVKDTKCTVTVPLCGKIAIMRTVYTEDSGTDFWNKVDMRLQMMRSLAEGDPVKITRAIKGYLQKDKNSYGGPGAHASTIAPEELNPWQQGVDDSLAAAAAEANAELNAVTDTEN